MDADNPLEPLNDNPLDASPPGNRILFVVLQVLAWAAAMGAIAAANSLGQSIIGQWFVVALVLGVFSGKLTLAALATVLGPWNLLSRMIVPPIWLVGELLMGFGLTETYSPVSSALLLCGLIVLFWLGLQIPMWLVRAWSRSRLCPPGVGPVAAASHREQFSIAQVLGLTFAVAAALGIGRALIPEDEFVRFIDFAPDALVAISAILLTAAVNGIVVYSFVLEEKSQARGLFGVALVTGLLCGMLSLTLTTFGAGSRHEMLIGSTAIIAGQTVWMLVSLGVLRSAGWRLVYAKTG
jgi:hypothetical protein